MSGRRTTAKEPRKSKVQADRGCQGHPPPPDVYIWLGDDFPEILVTSNPYPIFEQPKGYPSRLKFVIFLYFINP